MHLEVPDQLVETGSEDMPATWDRRYVRESEATGLEVQVVSRGSAGGWWAVVLPDWSVAELEVTQRLATTAQPAVRTLAEPCALAIDDTARLDKAMVDYVKHFSPRGVPPQAGRAVFGLMIQPMGFPARRGQARGSQDQKTPRRVARPGRAGVARADRGPPSS